MSQVRTWLIPRSSFLLNALLSPDHFYSSEIVSITSFCQACASLGFTTHCLAAVPWMASLGKPNFTQVLCVFIPLLFHFLNQSTNRRHFTNCRVEHVRQVLFFMGDNQLSTHCTKHGASRTSRGLAGQTSSSICYLLLYTITTLAVI